MLAEEEACSSADGVEEVADTTFLDSQAVGEGPGDSVAVVDYPWLLRQRGCDRDDGMTSPLPPHLFPSETTYPNHRNPMRSAQLQFSDQEKCKNRFKRSI